MIGCPFLHAAYNPSVKPFGFASSPYTGEPRGLGYPLTQGSQALRGDGSQLPSALLSPTPGLCRALFFAFVPFLRAFFAGSANFIPCLCIFLRFVV